MIKSDSYAISDFHFGAKGILNWERTQFATPQEHDEHILACMRRWYEKAAPGSVLWVLGDFGDTEMLEPFFNAVSGSGKFIELNFVAGNHDKAADLYKFEEYFDNVYNHPVYAGRRLILSHEPQWPIPVGCANIHGHTHNAHLDSKQHVTVSCNDIDYKPFKFSKLNGIYSNIERSCMKFLWEPYAEQYVFHDKTRNDIVMNPLTGKIDLPASRALQRSMRDENWNLKHD